MPRGYERASDREPAADEPDRVADRTASAVPPDGRVALFSSLQATAGNQAVASMVDSLQASRQGDAGGGASPDSLDADYRAAKQVGDWARAALLLNGFDDTDIDARVAPQQLPAGERDAMLAAVQPWNNRVRAALLDAAWNAAKLAGDWNNAAVHLNGFNDADIDKRIGPLSGKEVWSLYQGALNTMRGPSLHRLIDGIGRQHQETIAPSLGTDLVRQVITMQTAGLPVETARAMVLAQLKLPSNPDSSATKATGGPGAQETTIQTVATALAAAAIQPWMLDEGKIAHRLIGAAYAAVNEPTLVDPTMIAIVRALNLTQAAYEALYSRIPEELIESLRVRPDIVDLGKLQIYEIKSLGARGAATGEMLDYIELLDTFKIPGMEFSPGSPGNPGTSGVLPVEDGQLYYVCPWPGAIVYQIVRPPEHYSLERLTTDALDGHMMVGVESMTAVGVLAIAGYEVLLPLLEAAVTRAGQALPPLSPVTP